MASPGRRHRTLAGRGSRHDTSTPDVETSSPAYARRFAGPVGEWFLRVQSDAVLGLLGPRAEPPQSVLEVGGGHGQLVDPLAGAGFHVTTHGSHLSCHVSLGRQPTRRLVSDLWALPFQDRAFDVVVAVRLMAHVERWRELLVEMSRVARRFVLIDLPLQTALHRFSPALFRWKKRWESDTRPYFQYRLDDLDLGLEGAELERTAMTRQFFLPMALHRTLNRQALSRSAEMVAARMGLTRRFGSPAILLAERTSKPPERPTAGRGRSRS